MNAITALNNLVESMTYRAKIIMLLKRNSPILKQIIMNYFSKERRSIMASLKNMSNSEVEVWIQKTQTGLSIMIHTSTTTYSKFIKQS